MTKSTKRKTRDAAKQKKVETPPPGAEAKQPWELPFDGKPRVLPTVFIAFPADVSNLMPKYEDIPSEFLRNNTETARKWSKIQSDWFMFGMKNVQIKPKEGIDPAVAFRHLGAIQGSFQPKHEHKQAGVAYLMSLWFEDITYDRAKERA